MNESPARLPAVALALAMLLALAAACAPAVDAALFESPAAQELERVAHEAFHRMEIGFLQTGTYTTNVLVDLDVPRGARLTVEAYTESSYTLRLSSEALEGIAWLVSPDGVSREATEPGSVS